MFLGSLCELALLEQRLKENLYGYHYGGEGDLVSVCIVQFASLPFRIEFIT